MVYHVTLLEARSDVRVLRLQIQTTQYRGFDIVWILYMIGK